jgi:outer membrane autotransporter protein
MPTASCKIAIAAVASITSVIVPAASARAQNLASFAILGASAVTNTGPSVITGNVGLSPGTAITGFPPGSVVPPSAIFNSDATAIQAQIDLFNFYNNLSAMPATQDLTGQNLGGLTLTPGVYSFNSSAQLTGSLTLNGLGNPNAVFVFNIGSTLTTASASSILLINGAQGSNVFFRVGSSATLGTTTAFIGDIVALTSITLDPGAGINCGAALAHNGAVTLDDNTITVCLASITLISSILGGSASVNQLAVANTLDNFIAAGGVLPPAFLNLLTTLSPAALAAALTQLSGESATAAPPAAIQAMNSFLSLVVTPFDNREVTANPPDQAPLVYKASLYKAPSGFIAPDPKRWSTWVAAYGGTGTTQGDALVGSHEMSLDTYGVALGLDYSVMPTTVGVALAGGGTNFGVSDGLGGGSSDLFQAAIYSRTYFNAAYVAAALAYGWDRVSTSRYVTLADSDNLTAAFSGEQIAGRIESGYRLAMPNVAGWPGRGWFVPYGALQMQAFFTPSYSESAAPGSSSVFALNYTSQTTTDTRTELGVWFDRIIALDDGAILALRTRTAWAHDYWSGLDINAAFQSVPGSSFTVIGAVPAPNSLLASAGAEIAFKNGFSIDCWLDTQLAERSQTYSGNARLRYAF